jgi:hypothetical protein
MTSGEYTHGSKSDNLNGILQRKSVSRHNLCNVEGARDVKEYYVMASFQN